MCPATPADHETKGGQRVIGDESSPHQVPQRLCDFDIVTGSSASGDRIGELAEEEPATDPEEVE